MLTIHLQSGMNTLDKGYSVIITMPNKMSLVRFFTLSHCLSDEEDAHDRRRRHCSVHLVPRLSARRQRRLGTLMRAI